MVVTRAESRTNDEFLGALLKAHGSRPLKFSA